MSVGLVVGEHPNLSARDEEEPTPEHPAHSQSLCSSCCILQTPKFTNRDYRS